MATRGASAPRRKIGDILLAEGLIDNLQLRAAIGHQKKWGGKIGSALVDLGIVREEDIARVLEGQLREPCLTEVMLNPEPEALKLLTAEEATRHVVLPLRVDGYDLRMAMSNPSDLSLADELGHKLGKRVRGVLAVESAIKKCIRKYYGRGPEAPEYRIEMDSTAPDAPMEVIHHTKDTVEQPPRPEPRKEPGKVEPSADVISKALAYLLIEKGIIRRDELIERMKAIREKEEG